MARPVDRRLNNERKIFVGGLDFKTTMPGVIEYFSAFGEVQLCYMPLFEGKSDENRGFCFVTFAKKEASEFAAAMPGHKIDGRPVRVRKAFLRSEPGEPEPNPRLFVGGVREEHTKEVLMDYFRSYGAVRNVEIYKNRNTGRSRGFAFLSFYQNVGGAIRMILKQRFFTILGHAVEVKLAYLDTILVGQEQAYYPSWMDYAPEMALPAEASGSGDAMYYPLEAAAPAPPAPLISPYYLGLQSVTPTPIYPPAVQYVMYLNYLQQLPQRMALQAAAVSARLRQELATPQPPPGFHFYPYPQDLGQQQQYRAPAGDAPQPRPFEEEQLSRLLAPDVLCSFSVK